MISGLFAPRTLLLVGIGSMLWLAGCREDEAHVSAETDFRAAQLAWLQLDCFGDLDAAKTYGQGDKVRAYFTTRVNRTDPTSNQMGKGTLMIGGDRGSELVCVVQTQKSDVTPKPDVTPPAVPSTRPDITIPNTLPNSITTTTLFQPNPTPSNNSGLNCKPGEAISKCGQQALCLTPAARAAMKCS